MAESRAKMVAEVATSLGFTLREKQMETICAFIEGQDVFCCLPTGFGKSLCYALLPKLFDLLNKVPAGQSLVICVSPLTALMMDQKERFVKMGITAEFVSEIHQDLEKIKSGAYQLLFISPESLLNNPQWRDVLLSDTYQNNLVCVAIDEAHCVSKWGKTFRESYRRVGEVRSLIPPTVRIMGLTATASKTTRRQIYQILSLRNPVLVYAPPSKKNILYIVKKKESIEELVSQLARSLAIFKTEFPKMIIFCRRFEECAEFYSLFQSYLGENFTYPEGAPSIKSKFRVVEMFTSCTQQEVKETIIKSFIIPNGHLKIVISTIAFSMGLDVPNIRQIIHWGPSEDFESYIQETGRSGRDGNQSCALLYYTPKDKKLIKEEMIDYCTKESKCKRALLFADFEGCDLSTCCKCYCCCTCLKECGCSVNCISSTFFNVI